MALGCRNTQQLIVIVNLFYVVYFIVLYQVHWLVDILNVRGVWQATWCRQTTVSVQLRYTQFLFNLLILTACPIAE